MSDTIYTIGYTGFNLDEFISTIKSYGISLVVDVRSTPYSQRFPDYNKENLQVLLKESGVYYRNYAEEFGARQHDGQYYSTEGYLDFELFAKSEKFLSGVTKLENSINRGYKFVLMCSEKDPKNCHRAILVSRAFHERGYKIEHILPGEQSISQGQIEQQLLDKYFPDRNQTSMFEPTRTEEEYISMAYREQNKKIGYRMEEEEN